MQSRQPLKACWKHMELLNTTRSYPSGLGEHGGKVAAIVNKRTAQELHRVAASRATLQYHGSGDIFV
ncbi:hypothetical protein PVAP13_5NG376181 [Panicum virgatum]|uniref:Uncharacterized protein n=1 Tax=Panicum virgatum TaxID=38727 RepID=A0A8T0RYD0_PANVG|nr:hypothetical protein PVAP13_5NG376181 [Panicum virgatum]